MTASAGRRRRTTLVAAVSAVVAVVLAVVLAIAGGLTLYNSTEGADAASSTAERVFPDTATGLLAAVDDGGRLASLAVLVAQPSGVGGSIVTVPVSADASSGGADRLPIAETFELEGGERLTNEVEIALSLGFDQTEVVERGRLTELLELVGPIEVDLPAAVTGADGEVVVDAGAQTLDPAAAAAVLTSRDPGRPAGDQYAAMSAVWSAVAVAAAEGVETATLDGAGPIDGVLAQVMGGPVRQRALTYTTPDAESNPRGVDVVSLDAVELALIFGQIAPGRVSAPNPALTFRLENPIDDAAAAASGTSPAQLAYDAIGSLLFVRGNVLSVDSKPGDVPPVTTVQVSDDSLMSGVQGLETLLGPIEVSVVDQPIVGVDVIVRLGASYAEFLAAAGG